jgi:predicted nucleic acid-binding protein
VIVLDTNVVSELMRPAPSTRVVSWVGSQSASSLYVTTLTHAEILYGVLLLPAGRRRNAIESAAVGLFETEFAGRILSFDSAAAALYARVASDRRRSGRPISHFDAQIASITRANRATLATRNAKDFERCGIRLIDPWRTTDAP